MKKYCLQCNILYESKVKNRKFCSHKCYWKHLKENYDGYNTGFKKGHKGYKAWLGKKRFNMFGNKWGFKKGQIPWNKGIDYAQIKGKNHPNWQGGKSFEEYGVGFDNVLKEQIRFRDKYICQICGCSQLENGKQLDVHHKDYNKKNNKIENLISLCVSCHSKTHHNRDKWIIYFKGVCNEMA